MDYLECKKINNCFKDSQTFAYRLPITSRDLGEDFLRDGEFEINNQFRRPVFNAIMGTTRIKGILDESIIKVSFQNENWQLQKIAFEEWLKHVMRCRENGK